MTNRRRVVVTGIGLVSSLGIGTEANWAGIKAGQSGIGPITKFDVSAFSCRIGGEVRGFDPENYIDRKEVKKMDTFIHFAIAASKEAMADSLGSWRAAHFSEMRCTGAPRAGLMRSRDRRLDNRIRRASLLQCPQGPP